MSGTVLWPGNQDTSSRQNFQISKMTLWSKMLIGTSAIVSTFQTGGKRKEKKEGMVFPLEDTFWNLHMSLLLTPSIGQHLIIQPSLAAWRTWEIYFILYGDVINNKKIGYYYYVRRGERTIRVIRRLLYGSERETRNLGMKNGNSGRLKGQPQWVFLGRVQCSKATLPCMSPLVRSQSSGQERHTGWAWSHASSIAVQRWWEETSICGLLW